MPNPYPFLKKGLAGLPIKTKVFISLAKPRGKLPFHPDYSSAAPDLAPTGGDIPDYFRQDPFRPMNSASPNLRHELSKLPTLSPGWTRLYRAEPTVPITEQIKRGLPGMSEDIPVLETLRGQWFTNREESLEWFLTKRPDAKLLWFDAPKDVAKKWRADLHPDAGIGAPDIDEHILPRELLPFVNEVSFDIAYRQKIGPR